LLIVAGVACFALMVVHRLQVPKIANGFMREALRAQAEKRTPDTLRHLGRYVTLLPKDINGLALYGEELAQADRVGSAYFTLEKVLRIEPERADIRRQLVPLAMKMGRYQDALENIERLLKDAPDDGELWEYKGLCQAALAEYEPACESLQTAISHSPERLETYSTLATLLKQRLGRPEEAVGLMDLMVAKNSENFLAHLTRGQWRLDELSKPSSRLEPHVRSEMLGQVNTDTSRARELSPDSADVLAFSSRVALAMDDRASAREFITRGKEKHPGDPRFFLALADLEMAAKQSAAALDALRQGVAALPRNPDLRWNLVNWLIDAGIQAEAEEGVAQMRAMNQPAEQREFCEGRILLMQGQWQAAIQRLEAVRPRLMEWPDVVKQLDFHLARAYGETDALDLQITCLRRAVDLDPQWVPARVGLAESLMASNLIFQAADEYRRIRSIPNAPPSTGIDLAKCLFRLVARQTKDTQDWSEFDQVLSQVEQELPRTSQIPILRAEKLVNLDQHDDAMRLISQARQNQPEDLDLWIVELTLAQIERNWELADQILQAAKQQFGDTVTLRVVEGRLLMQRLGNQAGEALEKSSHIPETWSASDQFLFLRNFTLMFLVVGDYEEAERLGMIAAAQQPGDLSMRLMLCDVALRANQPELMERVLMEIRGITGEGPLWHYGEAVRLSLVTDPEKESHNLAQAGLHLVKAKAQRPTWTRIPLLSAEIATRRGDQMAATEHLQEAIKLGERNPAILSRTVSLLFAQKRFIEADQIVRRLGERQNLFTSDMLRSASEIAIRLNDTSRAIDMAEQLVRESDSGANKLWLAQVLGMVGRNQEAEEQLREVIAADPAAPEAWIVLVQVLTRSQQMRQAAQVVLDAEQAINAQDALLAVAQCYELIGNFDQARAKYELALEQSPEDEAVLRAAIQFQLKAGRGNEAEVLLRKMLQSLPDAESRERKWATLNLALALSMAGETKKIDEALTIIGENRNAGSATPADLRIQALVLARHPSLQQRRSAIPLLEKSLEQDSDTAIEDRYLLAKLCVATGDRAKARSEFRKLVVSRSNDLRFLSAFLQLLLQSGETTEAELWLPRLQEAAPDSLLTIDFQSQILFAQKHYPEVVTLLKESTILDDTAQDTPDVSLTTQLWGAKRFGEFAVALQQLKLPDESQRFSVEAEALYQSYIQQRPQEALVLAEHHARLNQVDRALELLTAHGTNAAPQSLVAVSVAMIKNSQTTPTQLTRLQESLQELRKTLPPSELLDLALADLMGWRGDTDHAAQLYRDVLKRNPQNIAALNNLAALWAMSGQMDDEALKLIQLAIDSRGQTGVLLDTRGMVCLAAGIPARALADFEESLREGEKAERYFHVALARVQMKQLEPAQRAFSRSLELGLTDQSLHPLERPMLAKLRSALGKS